jgi:hypothetical protein
MPPLFVSADLVTPTGHWFRVKATGNEIRVFPGPDFTFADLMDFYQMVLEKVDSNAYFVAGVSG